MQFLDNWRFTDDGHARGLCDQITARPENQDDRVMVTILITAKNSGRYGEVLLDPIKADQVDTLVRLIDHYMGYQTLVINTLNGRLSRTSVVVVDEIVSIDVCTESVERTDEDMRRMKFEVV